MARRIRSKAAIGASPCLVLLLSCGPLPAAAPFDPAQAETEIREIERSWAQVAVSGDPAVIERIFADDFLGVSPDGVQYTKRGFIEDTKANPLGFAAIELDEMKVRFLGNVAIAQGHETFTRKGGERGRFVWTDVLERRDGTWRIVAAQDAVASVAEPPAGGALFPGSEDAKLAKAEIDRTRNEYVAAWRAGNAAQIAELYTENALVLYPNQPAVSGRSAILGYFKSFFEEFAQSEFELSSLEIEIAGPWAFDRGTYRWKAVPRAGGSAVEDQGKYLVVLQRQTTGRWLVARDMDNSDRPLTQATRGTP